MTDSTIPVVAAYPVPIPIPAVAPPQEDVDDDPLSADTTTTTTTAAGPLSDEVRQLLADQGYTRGLQDAVVVNTQQAFARSVWILDNSGSMAHTDGRRIVESTDRTRINFCSCTRWKELAQTANYHAQLAACCRFDTTFYFLNDPGRAVGPPEFVVDNNETAAAAQEILARVSPGGVTPLIPHVHAIRRRIVDEWASQLDGTKVVLVLATDGLPTNDRGITSPEIRSEFVDALRTLEGLPVWLVVRLCTDEQDVVDFWSSLDDQLELSMDVLDDYQGEAAGVYAHNPWLNYGLPLHRMREMGFHARWMDLLDERPLTKDEVVDCLRVILGTTLDDNAPDADLDWNDFSKFVGARIRQDIHTWNPITQRMEPWVDMRQLDRQFGTGGWLSWLF